MFEVFTQIFAPVSEFIGTQVITGLLTPLIPSQRIFWLYLGSSGILAFYVFYVGARLTPARDTSVSAFIRFLFPEDVWRNPSAWLDIRYFFFHLIFRVTIYGMFLTGILELVSRMVAVAPHVIDVRALTPDSDVTDLALSTLYMFGLIAFVDFVGYAIHYVQHKSPLLWEFHKVHHSLEVMHPLSNYREHPIDNIVYAVGTGAAYGLFIGLSGNLFGYVPGLPLILGVPVLMFAFNFLGYNLRHSHVWLRWPGRWSMLFASPAHHHIHHSCHPDHVDRNFAFIFPCWDVLFRTYHLPETNEDVQFGISADYVNEFKSCLGIYFIPFRNALNLIFNRSVRRGIGRSTPRP
jgi:sterol desaturase/sphingolipid hydroxylase (fatty acid hydroxylase superfamily)